MFNHFARYEDAFREGPQIREAVPATDAQPPQRLMTHHGGLFAFPPGYAAHWIRLSADADWTANATLFYE